MAFPVTRIRRLRGSEGMRRMVRQACIHTDDLVYPLFVVPGHAVSRPIQAMPGCSHLSADMAAAESQAVARLGIPAILLFGVPSSRDDSGSGAWAEDGIVQRAVRSIKKSSPDLIVATDVCLCAYTSNGHCGTLKNGRIDNDATCRLLAKTALSHAQAGADIVAPSDMMDGRIGIIRRHLDENGFEDTAIMAYAAKYASAFYGPFREAAGSAPAFGDRKTYQIDPCNSDQAMREIEMDIEEGADIVMVKPALCYLDVICRAKKRFDVPIAAYNVSGEFMMVNSASEAGCLERDAAMMEMLLSIKRAGADIVITYFAKRAAELLLK